MIIKSGPGKIILPDATEIDVIFDVLNIEFSKTGHTYADFTFCSDDAFPSIAGGRVNIISDQIETVEINGENCVRSDSQGSRTVREQGHTAD